MNKQKDGINCQYNYAIHQREKIELEFRRKNPFRTTIIWRADGRLEWMCKHGAGHTVFAPAIRQDNGVVFRDWVHGCDGCCKGIKVVRE